MVRRMGLRIAVSAGGVLCTLDSECLPGMACLSYGHYGCEGIAFACQMGTDQCTTNADCAGDGMYCAWRAEGRQCQQAGCPAGG
jgi:hypothetical protein